MGCVISSLEVKICSYECKYKPRQGSPCYNCKVRPTSDGFEDCQQQTTDAYNFQVAQLTKQDDDRRLREKISEEREAAQRHIAERTRIIAEQEKQLQKWEQQASMKGKHGDDGDEDGDDEETNNCDCDIRDNDSQTTSSIVSGKGEQIDSNEQQRLVSNDDNEYYSSSEEEEPIPEEDEPDEKNNDTDEGQGDFKTKHYIGDTELCYATSQQQRTPGSSPKASAVRLDFPNPRKNKRLRRSLTRNSKNFTASQLDFFKLLDTRIEKEGRASPMVKEGRVTLVPKVGGRKSPMAKGGSVSPVPKAEGRESPMVKEERVTPVPPTG